MFGTKVDKNGDNPKYISSEGTPKKNVTTVSEGIPMLKASSGYYYAKMASAHIAKKTVFKTQQHWTHHIKKQYAGIITGILNRGK